MLGAHDEVAAWLGLSAAGPALPPAPVARREPLSREPPDVREEFGSLGLELPRLADPSRS